MAAVRTFTLPHYEAYPVQVALFKDVKNADFLRSQLLAANPAFDYAFLDAAMILTPLHLLTATFHALHAFATHTQKTRTPHSELVFRLSPNNNIGASYKTFGIAPDTTSLVCVKLPLRADGSADERVTRDSVAAHLGQVVEGESVQVGELGEGLGQFAEVHRVKKVYKIACAKGGSKGMKDDRGDLESVVLGAIALKGS
ncbi:uncharacterized protein EKO05_0002613 [Ascochyta rabiei]|uniref:EKC/KEOPS complex subunit CGI121 n=1 Tax=Didymella rabiei TaxID=5454 RepID=A0A163ILG0_DIDRA|nr:uncharacterized protein EKO05_0002613 [Ascochyta rabiei]KZM25801.1 nucleus [Ascochyta rabiei]UPX12036.1 hypothetical protein EKO05_0002613 [Ascochyta rabiei]